MMPFVVGLVTGASVLLAAQTFREHFLDDREE